MFRWHWKHQGPSNNGNETKGIENCHEPNWKSADLISSQMAAHNVEECSLRDGTLQWKDVFHHLQNIVFPEIAWIPDRYVCLGGGALGFCEHTILRRLVTEKPLTNVHCISWALVVCYGIGYLIFSWVCLFSRRKVKVALFCSSSVRVVIWKLLEEINWWDGL